MEASCSVHRTEQGVGGKDIQNLLKVVRGRPVAVRRTTRVEEGQNVYRSPTEEQEGQEAREDGCLTKVVEVVPDREMMGDGAKLLPVDHKLPAADLAIQ